MTRLGFIMTGPHGGQAIEMEDAELAQAVKDGWALDFEKANTGGNPDPFAGHNTEPHEKAEAWLAKRGLYTTREIRAAPPQAAPADKEAEAEPAKRKPGRPAKK